MIKNLKRIVLVMCVLALCTAILGTTAFAASDSLVAKIPVKITLNGTLPAQAETFTVQVKATTPGAPLPAGSTGDTYEMKLSGAGNVITGELAIDFSAAGRGEFNYTIQQVAGSDPDCTYDTTVYNMKVYVLNKEDMSGLEMHVIITCGDQKPDSIDFTNKYCDPALVTITAIKTLNGGVPASNMFLFQLLDENGKVVTEVRNDKGTVTFKPLVFGEPEDVGTHTYTLLEVDENANSITYDKSKYTVIIEVFKGEDGNYDAKVSYKLKGAAYEGTPTFANKMKIANSPYTGDNLQIILWGGLMAVSAFALIALFLVARKKRLTMSAFQRAMDEDSDADLDEE